MTHPVKLLSLEHTAFKNTAYVNLVGNRVKVSPAVSNEVYSDAQVARRISIEVYFDKDLAVAFFQEIYGNKNSVFSFSEEKYGEKTGVFSLFQEKYGSFLTLFQTFQEKYETSLELLKVFQEKYDEVTPVFSVQSESWDVLSSLNASFLEKYGISGISLVKEFEEGYPLTEKNFVQKEFTTPYYILEGSTIHYTPTISLTVNDEEIDFLSFSIEGGLDKYCLLVEISVSTLNDYSKFTRLDSVILIVDGTTYNLFVESKEKTATMYGYEYRISCLSDTAKLDAPYSDPIIKDYPTNVLASVVIQEMADIKGISVENTLVDWYLSPISFSIQEETPLEVIRRIANAVGGILQTKPDGTLLLISEYPVSPQYWETSIPEGVFSLETDVLQLDESTVVNSGYNAFIVTDQGSDSKIISLEETDVDATTKIIKGFQVPFDEADPFTLQTSGGIEVTITKHLYPITEQVPSDTDEWEIVEFLEKTGKTKYPIYAIIDYDWIEDDLGTISYEEDGTLTVDSIKTESLLKIKYNTKYWKWTVTGIENKYTQFYVPSL